MGAGLVGVAMSAQWAARLNSTEQLVLVAMSLTARDTSSAGVEGGLWWAGSESLMLALDGAIHDPGTREREAAERRIRRAMAKLQDVGAIRRKHAATARRRSVWEITTNQAPLPVDNPVYNPVDGLLRTIETSGSAGHQCPAEPDTNVRPGGHQCPAGRTSMSGQN